MKELLQYAAVYLEKKVEGFKYKNKAKSFFTCPFCSSDEVDPYSANNLDKTHGYVRCAKCKFQGNIFDLVRKVESDKAKATDDEIAIYLRDFLKVSVPLVNKEIEEAFAYYQKQGFDLLPITAARKKPYEPANWPNIEHKDINEWRAWLQNKLNIGVKTGKRSGITVFDVDSKKLPKIFQEILDDNSTLIQKTGKGYHFFFKYDESFPKTSFEYEGVHVDLQSDGGQVLIFPCYINNTKDGNRGYDRNFIKYVDIQPVPEKLKEALNEKPKKDKPEPVTKTEPELAIDPKNIQLKNNNLQGCCNQEFVKLGGLLVKELSMRQTSYVLNVLNRNLLEKPMSQTDVSGMLRSLERYQMADCQDMANKIYNYLRLVEFANSKEVREALNEPREVVDKALSLLTQEERAVKKGRNYWAIQKPEWSDKIPPVLGEVGFDIPYFSQVAKFRWGDLILLGSQTKNGKTTIAMNIAKGLIEQGIKPYYSFVETGGRWQLPYNSLGLSDKQMYHSYLKNIDCLEIEKNSVNILDWLVVTDFAQTQNIFQTLSDKLHRANGILIVFAQLKKDDSWFAPNLIDLFCALGAKYIYDKESNGKTGKWFVDPIRESKINNMKSAQIPCRYDWNSRQLITLEAEAKKAETEKPMETVTL